MAACWPKRHAIGGEAAKGGKDRVDAGALPTPLLCASEGGEPPRAQAQARMARPLRRCQRRCSVYCSARAIAARRRAAAYEAAQGG